MLKPGDQVILHDPFWYQGVNLGGKLGIVISIEGYVLVQVSNYENNPVKCFQYEVDKFIDLPNDPVLDELNSIWEGDEFDFMRT